MYEHFPHPTLLGIVLCHVQWYREESFQRPHSNLMLDRTSRVLIEDDVKTTLCDGRRMYYEVK